MLDVTGEITKQQEEKKANLDFEGRRGEVISRLVTTSVQVRCSDLERFVFLPSLREYIK